MLGAIFAQIFREFVKAVRYFALICTKSKLLGVRFQPMHPRLLHQWLLKIFRRHRPMRVQPFLV